MILDILMDLLVMNKYFDNSKIRCQLFQSSDAKQTKQSKFKDFISSIILAFDGNWELQTSKDLNKQLKICEWKNHKWHDQVQQRA